MIKYSLSIAIPIKVNLELILVGNMRKCKCPSYVNYPNLTFYSGHITFNITPTSYILGSYNNRICMLGIDNLPEAFADFIILGDIFFHHQTIIFDK